MQSLSKIRLTLRINFIQEMNNCRICNSHLGKPIYSSKGKSITSVRGICDCDLIAYYCEKCDLLQKPPHKNISEYYDNEYRISMDSPEHDQLYHGGKDSEEVFRTTHQASIILKHVNIPTNGRILDYGGGKGATLGKISEVRKDIKPYIFDVSEDYKISWDKFLGKEQQATYKIPDNWAGRFDLVMMNFVLEHVETPLQLLTTLSGLVAEGGMLLLIVPNVISNPGDMIAVDHINHFSRSSISYVLDSAGLELLECREDLFRGALVCIAKKSDNILKKYSDVLTGINLGINKVVDYWMIYDQCIAASIENFRYTPSAIYGAGVYGSYLALKLAGICDIRCFLDNSVYLQNKNHLGYPVVSPENINNKINIVYSGLNPYIARDIISAHKFNSVQEIIYFDMEK